MSLISQMTSPHGKAAATMVEAMPTLLMFLGSAGTRDVFRNLLEKDGHCCGTEVGLPRVTHARARTEEEMKQLVHQQGHQLANGIVGLIEAGVSRKVIRQIFNDSLNSIMGDVQSITLPEGFDPNDAANQKLVEDHFNLMDGEKKYW